MAGSIPIVRLGGGPGVRAERSDHEVLRCPPPPSGDWRPRSSPSWSSRSRQQRSSAPASRSALPRWAVTGRGGRRAPPRRGGPVAGDLDALLAADRRRPPCREGRPNPNKAVPGLRRLAAGSRLVHGTVLVDLPALGGLTTIQVDHGTIKAVRPTSLSVSETGGTTATVSLGDETRVRKHAAKAKVGDLAVGDEVFVMSKVAGGATEAYSWSSRSGRSGRAGPRFSPSAGDRPRSRSR